MKLEAKTIQQNHFADCMNIKISNDFYMNVHE